MTSERVLKLTLEYEGTAYCGWQLQPDRPTIQGTLEQCLSRIVQVPCRVHGAGRTDSGVHARGQVAHVVLHRPMACDTLQRALNALLPDDIAVTGLEVAPAGFDARRSAVAKQYSYHLLNRRQRSVFLRHTSWQMHLPLAMEAMEEAGALLVGKHDFSAFRGAGCTAHQPVRRILAQRWTPRPDGRVVFEVMGEGFLKHMVRNIVGTLVEVGLGRRTVEEFGRILEQRDRRQAGPTAPARGLCLDWVAYDPLPEDPFSHNPPLPALPYRRQIQ